MSTNKRYDEDLVASQLNLKNDIRVHSQQRVIEILREPNAKCDVGIKSKGKIDFLTNFCNYTIYWTLKF